MTSIVKKRFIAGAVCPDCGAVDRIVVETALEGGVELSRRRCVACGFADEFAAGERAASSAVPRGRPEKPRRQVTPSTPVRILDPKDKGGRG